MKKRVLFVNDEMVMGGVARILINTLKVLDQDKFDVTVLILHAHGELLDQIPAWVKVIHGTSFFDGVDVNLKSALKQQQWLSVYQKLKLLISMKTQSILKDVSKERNHLKLDELPYDIEVAAKEGFCTLFVSQGKSKRKINWIHVDYSAQNYSKHHMPLMRKVVSVMDENIAVSIKAKEAYQNLFSPKSIISINNLMDIQSLKQQLSETIDFKPDSTVLNLITVARFHPQKSIDRLIIAFQQALMINPNLCLYLIGSGELESELKALVKSLKIDSSVIFLGQKNKPLPYISKADLFVLSSLYEGYPTSVLESLIAKTPVLSTLVSGIQEQIQEGINGWIVDNTQDALTHKLIELVQDEKKLHTLKQEMPEYLDQNAERLVAFEKALLGEIT